MSSSVHDAQSYTGGERIDTGRAERCPANCFQNAEIAEIAEPHFRAETRGNGGQTEVTAHRRARREPGRRPWAEAQDVAPPTRGNLPPSDLRGSVQNRASGNSAIPAIPAPWRREFAGFFRLLPPARHGTIRPCALDSLSCSA